MASKKIVQKPASAIYLNAMASKKIVQKPASAKIINKLFVQKPASAMPGVIKASVMKKPAGSSKVVRKKPAKPSADDNRYACTDDSSDSDVRYHQWSVDTLAEKVVHSNGAVASPVTLENPAEP